MSYPSADGGQPASRRPAVVTSAPARSSASTTARELPPVPSTSARRSRGIDLHRDRIAVGRGAQHATTVEDERVDRACRQRDLVELVAERDHGLLVGNRHVRTGEAHRLQALAPRPRAARAASAAARRPSRAPSAANAAFCIGGDSECDVGQPSRPTSVVVPRISISREGSWREYPRRADPPWLHRRSAAGVAVLAHLAQERALARREEVPLRAGNADVVEVVHRGRMGGGLDRGETRIRDRRRRQARELPAVVGVVARDRSLGQRLGARDVRARSGALRRCRAASSGAAGCRSPRRRASARPVPPSPSRSSRRS